MAPSGRDFAGQVAVVTGAGSGIGRSTALLLGRMGARVYAADIDGRKATTVARDANGHGHQLDVSDPAAVEAFAEAVFEAEGAVDVLHNNAGIGHAGAVEDITLDEWHRVLGVNLMGVIHGVHFFVPRMLRQGRSGHVVNTASLAGLVAVAEMAPYCTSKHAVVGLSESLNAELSPRGVHVTAICPGFINTTIIDDAYLDGKFEGQRSRIKGFYERFGSSPDVVAEAVVDAIRRKKMIRTVPRHHVIANWALRRLSPKAAQPLARASTRFISGRG